MSAESLTLKPHSYDKLGILHCGVLEDYTAVCAGELHKLEDGESFTFERAGVTVKRSGDEFVFTKQ
ncbi:MAG TPA: hypothetical protein ENI93_04880 [Gammaproteobacteria bacterium]|nr:hypothetical protein [Gammaproteobacteria bacterium]